MNKEIIPAQREFDLAWQEFFKDKPNPKNDEEEKNQMEEFVHWYNNIRKQTDTGKTPAEMYKEIYGKEPPKKPVEISRIMNFEWDENYDEELIGLIEELKEYDYEKGYKLNYETVKGKLKPTINKITEKGENSLGLLHEILENEETWSCLFALEILEKIKSEKSIPYLIRFIEKNEEGNYFENCDIAMQALINIGKPAVEEIISSIKNGLERNTFKGYLFEALSKIKDERGKELRLELLKDYLNNPKKYQGWFNLTMFICNFNEDENEALPFLKELKKRNLTEEESRELESAVEIIENPEKHKKKINQQAKELEPLFRKIIKKVGRNEPCPCGSGKKYKKCCLREKEGI